MTQILNDDEWGALERRMGEFKGYMPARGVRGPLKRAYDELVADANTLMEQCTALRAEVEWRNRLAQQLQEHRAKDAAIYRDFSQQRSQEILDTQAQRDQLAEALRALRAIVAREDVLHKATMEHRDEALAQRDQLAEALRGVLWCDDCMAKDCDACHLGTARAALAALDGDE